MRIDKLKLSSKLVWYVGALSGALLASVVLYKTMVRQPAAFLTTSSPDKRYKVDVTGQKERPRFFTVEVRFHVNKDATPYVSDKFLHSGDSEDPSFEMLYPNHRWMNERTIQFYREEYFQAKPPDTLVLTNNTGETIKYARIRSVDTVLVFDLKAGVTETLITPSSRGDLKWLEIDGEFVNGQQIVSMKKDIQVPRNSAGSTTYHVGIHNDRITVDGGL